MLARESGRAIALHQPRGGGTIRCGSGLNADVAGRLLHNDTKDYTFFDADFCGFVDGVPDKAYVIVGVSSCKHLRLVVVEDGLKGSPGGHGWEGGCGTGVGCEAHFCSFGD